MLEVLATAVVESKHGLTSEAIIATLLYTGMGILIMVVSIVLINALFKLNLRHELKKDHNVAYGVAIAGFAVAISIIIAGTISS